MVTWKIFRNVVILHTSGCGPGSSGGLVPAVRTRRNSKETVPQRALRPFAGHPFAGHPAGAARAAPSRRGRPQPRVAADVAYCAATDCR
jgi:hypothetical protein